MPATSARSCEIKIDRGQWWVAERSVRKNKRNPMIKELGSIDIRHLKQGDAAPGKFVTGDPDLKR